MSLKDRVGSAEDAIEIDQLRSALARAQQEVVKAKARTDHLVEATITAARDAVLARGPIKPVPRPKVDKRRKDPEVALMVMGDWQGHKVTTSYNGEVMKARVLAYMDKVERITEIQRADHPVTKGVVSFGGDMVEGLFNYPTQPFEIDATLFEQYVSVSMLLVDVVRRALALFDTVEVVAEWGNHGRIGSKRDAVPRSDNVDRMAYELARQLLKDEPRVTWPDCPEDIQRLEIGNYRALVIHGDEIGRGGFSSPNTIVQHVNRWRSGAYPWAFTDCYIHHYHQHQEWALADGKGSVYMTGSTESDNRYARETMAASAIPSQRLHFIDPEAGRVTAQYKVWLD